MCGVYVCTFTFIYRMSACGLTLCVSMNMCLGVSSNIATTSDSALV